MYRYRILAAGIAAACLPVCTYAADTNDLQQIRAEMEQLQRQYETRLKALEQKLQAVQETAQAPAPRAPQSSSNAFNPDVSLILSGLYGNLSKNPEGYRISNFATGADSEIGPGSRGFSLSETELGIAANIDPWFYGAVNLSIAPDDKISAEEAFIQTTALPHGFRIKSGRFFSGIGYLNEQHAHTWDFVDAPLAYQAFLGSQYKQEGVQFKWLAPTATFLELGGELGAGSQFPGAERNKNGPGASSVFLHVGDDIGISHSWRAGISLLQTRPQDRRSEATDLSEATVNNAFTGSSRLWLADWVWKWAPNGDATKTAFKLQGEYFRRRERGTLSYDVDNTNSADAYRSAQSGWYLQALYQFMPNWRVGLRQDRLNSGTVDYGSNADKLANTGFNPQKQSLMFDWSPSEFSRVRLQFARDRSHEAINDRQVFLQYQMSLGAHGAHAF